MTELKMYVYYTCPSLFKLIYDHAHVKNVNLKIQVTQFTKQVLFMRESKCTKQRKIYAKVAVTAIRKTSATDIPIAAKICDSNEGNFTPPIAN